MKKYTFLGLLLFLVGTLSYAQRDRKAATPINTTLSSTSATDRLAGYEIRKSLTENSLVKNLKFRNIGPTAMNGRIVDIDANPENPTEFYVAYASGGLWKTVNNGLSFQPLFDNEAVITIGDIAVDWKNKTLWVGTGENNSSRSSYSGVGIYKSTDDGKTWQHLGLSDSHHIGRIALHPTDANIAWVAALGHLYSPNDERGIFKTTDGGKTWKKTLFINEVTGAIDVRVSPKNSEELYASMWHRERTANNFVESGSESGIYKSTDSGSTWQQVTTPESGFPQGKGNGRIGLSVNESVLYAIIDNQTARPKEDKKAVDETAQSLSKKVMKTMTKESFLALSDKTINEYLDAERFPETFNAKQLKEEVTANKITVNDIYLYTHNDNDDLFDIQIVGAEVYKSQDAAKTWQKTNKNYLDGMYYTYGYYFGQIWVAPTNDQKVVIAGVPVVRSEDGGQTFKSMDAGNVHADHHALWFNPKNSNHFILGNDGGINITYDNGKTWFKANSVPAGQFYAVAFDKEKPYNVYGGLQDNGVWVGPSTNNFDFNFGIFDEGDGFKFLLGGDGMQVQVDWRDNETLYTGFQFGNYFRINRRTGERKYLQIPRKMGEEQFRFNWESPIHLSRHNQDILYFGSHKFHRSFDQGNSWQTLSGDLTRGKYTGNVPFGTLTSIEESAKRFGLLYVGSDDGLAHVSKDGGYTWEKIADKPDLWCVGVVPSAHQEATVYAAFNGYRKDHFGSYLYASTDYGKTWKTIGTNLPAEPINVVREDPSNEAILYLGTDHGLYISFDKGVSFHRSGGLPAVSVHDLQIQPVENELIVGTHGRSIYVANIKNIQEITQEILAKKLHLYSLKELTHSENWGRIENKYEEQRPQKYPISYFSTQNGTATIQVKTASGLVLKTISNKTEKGLTTFDYDLTIDKTAKEALETELNKDKKEAESPRKLTEADDKQLYLPTGSYTIEIELNGEKQQKVFEIKERKRNSRRAVFPQGSTSPDEFNEWYEDMGFEHGKK
jgi:photosystem II stability/assembly factor-like uncharacterized protein